MLALPLRRESLAIADSSDHPLSLMVRKLSLWQPLSDEDRAMVLELPYHRRSLTAAQYLVWDGDRPQNACLLLSGFACRHKSAGNGGRQILSIHMKGDILDLQNSLLGIADHNVQMLTAGEVAMIPVHAIEELAALNPRIGMAMWYETLVEGSIFREWMLNVSRRDARTRIAHLLCELGLRLEVVELGDTTSYELPITQEQLADAVALTPVHVNRTLMRLEADGLITRTKRMVSIVDWKELAEVADFEPRYLHLGRSKLTAAAAPPVYSPVAGAPSS
jgi:CRP-like cAMP-binding protein